MKHAYGFHANTTARCYCCLAHTVGQSEHADDVHDIAINMANECAYGTFKLA